MRAILCTSPVTFKGIKQHVDAAASICHGMLEMILAQTLVHHGLALCDSLHLQVSLSVKKQYGLHSSSFVRSFGAYSLNTSQPDVSLRYMYWCLVQQFADRDPT